MESDIVIVSYFKLFCLLLVTSYILLYVQEQSYIHIQYNTLTSYRIFIIRNEMTLKFVIKMETVLYRTNH